VRGARAHHRRVAHHLATVQRVDVIHVLAGGRVVEWGAHAELLAQRGMY